jgi:hypothetical protein
MGLGLLHCIFIKRSDLLFKIQTVTHEILRSSMPTAALSPDVISFWVRKTVGSLGEIPRAAAGLLNKIPVDIQLTFF